MPGEAHSWAGQLWWEVEACEHTNTTAGLNWAAGAFPTEEKWVSRLSEGLLLGIKVMRERVLRYGMGYRDMAGGEMRQKKVPIGCGIQDVSVYFSRISFSGVRAVEWDVESRGLYSGSLLARKERCLLAAKVSGERELLKQGVLTWAA